MPVAAKRKEPVEQDGPPLMNDQDRAKCLKVTLEELHVPWDRLPMEQARALYAQLKGEFEKAGNILNARSFPPNIGRYACTMCGCTCKDKRHKQSVNPADHEPGCKKVHEGDARGKDDSYKDPETGLYVPVRICGEEHWIRWQQKLIEERRERNLVPRTS